MQIDIYIREKSGSRSIRIPWLPEKIEFKSGGTVRATYDIIDKGPVEVPSGSGLCIYSWKSQFPGQNRTDKSMMRGEWADPSTYHQILESWRVSGTPLNLMVTGYPINKDVIIDDYTGTAAGGFGDWEYEIKFIEERNIIVQASVVATQPKRQETQSSTKTYTIKSGDTLWGIAQRFKGSGASWESIYNANKQIIESTATSRWKAAGINRDSQHGHWIFPGTTITIP